MFKFNNKLIIFLEQLIIFKVNSNNLFLEWSYQRFNKLKNFNELGKYLFKCLIWKNNGWNKYNFLKNIDQEEGKGKVIFGL